MFDEKTDPLGSMLLPAGLLAMQNATTLELNSPIWGWLGKAPLFVPLLPHTEPPNLHVHLLRKQVRTSVTRGTTRCGSQPVLKASGDSKVDRGLPHNSSLPKALYQLPCLLEGGYQLDVSPAGRFQSSSFCLDGPWEMRPGWGDWEEQFRRQVSAAKRDIPRPMSPPALQEARSPTVMWGCSLEVVPFSA